jgi:hypothetical protein
LMTLTGNQVGSWKMKATHSLKNGAALPPGLSLLGRCVDNADNRWFIGGALTP